MNYEAIVAAFKDEVKKQFKEQDTFRPYKKSKRQEIRVTENEDGFCFVELFFDQRFYRMFGQHLTVLKIVFKGDLKEGCKHARELKKLLPSFSIDFLSWAEQKEFRTEMM